MNICTSAAVGILLLLGARGFASEPVTELPKAVAIDRYQTMIERSPFALATQSAPVRPVADVPGFAKDLVLTGAVRLASGEYVTLASRDGQSQRFGLRTGETYNDIAMVSVAWSDAVGKTTVTLKRGNEFGVVGFDEAAVRSGPTGPPSGAPQQGAAPPAASRNPVGSPPNMVSPGGNPSAAPGSPIRRRIIRTAPPPP